jgi:lipid-A-disaccharide synthase
MTPKRFMVIAGETSGDMLAAELVRELRAGIQRRYTYSNDLQPLQSDLAPRFFGAGGPRMAQAGVELAFDLTRHSVVGLTEVLRNYFKFRCFFRRLLALACEREPHVIICVDYAGFNRRFAAAIKKYVHARRGTFNNWDPKIIQYVSPQVWASREGRARQIARDVDLLLAIFPFEKDWYAGRVPKLRVEFVGHPMMDRYARSETPPGASGQKTTDAAEPLPKVLLLPGSRRGELAHHLPVMIGALGLIQKAMSIQYRIVLPEDMDILQVHEWTGGRLQRELLIQKGGLAEALAEATIAIASTGTVTMECAYFGVPTVTLYKTSWSTYEIGKRIIKVKWLTMPNLLANEDVFPEFIQDAATPKNISEAALKLLRDRPRRDQIKIRLGEIVTSLGGPGASRRAAEAVLSVTP